MRDYDIREVLEHKLCTEHQHQPDTLVLHELGLCQGSSRIDLAVINGVMTGYEIKSDKDTLERLPAQILAYGSTLDFVTLVVGRVHAVHALELVPSWWGVILAQSSNDSQKVSLSLEREALPNPNVNALAVAEFLWREEALNILIERGWEKGIKSKPRQVLWQRLVDNLELEELQRIVRQTLKSRVNWRSDLVQTQSGARIPLVAN